jgi:hypothetical protein
MSDLTAKTIDQFFTVLGVIVSADNPWKEKLQMIKSAASSDDETNLEEFVGWFDDAE